MLSYNGESRFASYWHGTDSHPHCFALSLTCVRPCSAEVVLAWRRVQYLCLVVRRVARAAVCTSCSVADKTILVDQSRSAFARVMGLHGLALHEV
jgi:hypothetical protein